jgi:nucleotidyltransferase substrate binding protein (TIGR01987 family)
MSRASTDFPLLKDFTKAISKLKYALSLKKTEIVRDSAIKRFELCFDLAWKCIQAYARNEGIECHSPRSCLKTAVQLGLIGYDDAWLRMLEDRNLAVHTYKQKYAEELYGRLSAYLCLLTELAKKLEA